MGHVKTVKGLEPTQTAGVVLSRTKYWLRRLKSGTVRRDEVQGTAGRDIQRKMLRLNRRLLPTKFLPSVKCPHGPCFCSLVCCTIVNMFSLQTCLLTVPNNIYSSFCTRHASTYRNVQIGWQSITVRGGLCLFACMYEWCNLFVFIIQDVGTYWIRFNIQ